MLRTTDLEIIVHRVFVDHAIYWFPWTCPVLDAAEQSPNSSHGRVVHGMQSGLMRFRITIHVDLYVASSFSSSFFLEIWLTGVTILFFWQGSDAFSQSGLYSNHQDIGPRYAVMT